MAEVSIAHILNPVASIAESDLSIAQPITFESIRRSRQLAEEGQVQVYSTQYPEDHGVIPEWVIKLSDLNRSVVDVAKFTKQRKLPLIADVLNKLESIDATHIIYSNIDIGVLPHFYSRVIQLINEGYDGFVINRRTISGKYKETYELPAMYSDMGLPHPGYDCIVFEKKLLHELMLGNVCIGAPRIGYTLVINLIARCKHFGHLHNEHLTFHIGDDRNWQNQNRSEFAEHNLIESTAIEDILINRTPVANVPNQVTLPILKQYLSRITGAEHSIDRRHWKTKLKGVPVIGPVLLYLNNVIRAIAGKR